MPKAIDKPSEKILVPEGTHPVRIVQMVHMGTVEDNFGGSKDTVRLTFEFPTETHVFDTEKGEQPLWLANDYTLNFNEKSNLRKIANATGLKAKKDEEDGFEYIDVEDLLDKTCLVAVEHVTSKAGNEYCKLAAFSPLMKGMKVEKASQDLLSYSVIEPDNGEFDKLPEWLQDKIKTSWQYQNKDNKDTDVPFNSTQETQNSPVSGETKKSEEMSIEEQYDAYKGE